MGTTLLFHDGHCGLCHWAVRWLLRADPSGRLFRFAPLGGPTYLRTVPPARRDHLPDSLLVLTETEQFLTQSDAVLYLMRRLGGPWRAASRLLALLPRPLRDALYDLIARTRYRLLGTRADTCQPIPTELRQRFHP